MHKLEVVIMRLWDSSARNNAATKISEAAKVIYLIHPIFFRGSFGTL